MEAETYYLVFTQDPGWFGYDYLCYIESQTSTYAPVRTKPGKWDRTDVRDEAYRFETHGKAAKIAKRLKILRDVKWKIVKITEQTVEASDESPLIKLARCAE